MSDSGMGSEKPVIDSLSGEGGCPASDVVEAMCAVTRELMGARLTATVESGRGKRFVEDVGIFSVLLEGGDDGVGCS